MNTQEKGKHTYKKHPTIPLLSMSELFPPLLAN